MKILSVVGARPNFMKIAPIARAFQSAATPIDHLIVHTGQHYDEKMSDLFFRQLGIPEPDINLEVGSGSHATQTADIMKRFEPVLIEHKPDAVLVVGDVNSTIACGLVTVKLGIRLIHVEAGLRSFDRSMPEEINRILTDTISHFLFCTEESGVTNLKHEGIPLDRIFLVGNVMIDTLHQHREKADQSTILHDLKLTEKEYAVLTLHRPSNVDNPETLNRILDALEVIQKDMPILFPIHPRTRQSFITMGLNDRIAGMSGIHLIDPIGYIDFLKLTMDSGLVLTDSGGIQEETTILQVPCLTLRENTERPITITKGTNQLVGTQPENILKGYSNIKEGLIAKAQIPPLWDGHAAERIAEILLKQL